MNVTLAHVQGCGSLPHKEDMAGCERGPRECVEGGGGRGGRGIQSCQESLPSASMCISFWLNGSLHTGGLPFCSTGQVRGF